MRQADIVFSAVSDPVCGAVIIIYIYHFAYILHFHKKKKRQAGGAPIAKLEQFGSGSRFCWRVGKPREVDRHKKNSFEPTWSSRLPRRRTNGQLI